MPNEIKQRAGRIGAARRWGPRRIVRLDALDPTVRGVVLALIEADAAARKEAAPVIETSGTAMEARRVGDEPSAA